jgi:chromosome segregation ATPase
MKLAVTSGHLEASKRANALLQAKVDESVNATVQATHRADEINLQLSDIVVRFNDLEIERSRDLEGHVTLEAYEQLQSISDGFENDVNALEETVRTLEEKLEKADLSIDVQAARIRGYDEFVRKADAEKNALLSSVTNLEGKKGELTKEISQLREQLVHSTQSGAIPPDISNILGVCSW